MNKLKYLQQNSVSMEILSTLLKFFVFTSRFFQLLGNTEFLFRVFDYFFYRFQ